MHVIRPHDTACSGANQAAEWFVRLRSERCSAREREAFARWLESDPAHRKEYAAVEALWTELDALQPPVAPPRRHPLLPWAAAATALLATAAGLYTILTPELERTARGEIRDTTLTDGTRVRLNANTELAIDFTATARRVELRRGEALFEVARDPGRPFSVTTGETTVRDIGTRFDLKRDSDAVLVAVTQGRVEIDRGDDADGRCRVDAGFAATAPSAGPCTVAPLDPDRLAWLEGRLIFHDTPLGRVVEEYNRYREPPLHIADDATANLRLSGSFQIDHLGELPALLPRTLPVTVEAAESAWLLRASTPRR